MIKRGWIVLVLFFLVIIPVNAGDCKCQDIDQNGEVNIVDELTLGEWVDAWAELEGFNVYIEHYDLNGDDIINEMDLACFDQANACSVDCKCQDINEDGDVDIWDRASLQNHIQQYQGFEYLAYVPLFDLDGNGSIGDEDLVCFDQVNACGADFEEGAEAIPVTVIDEEKQKQIIDKLGYGSEGKKTLTKYDPYEVFIVDNSDWKSVSRFVPTAIWMDEDKVNHRYPFLVYHTQELPVRERSIEDSFIMSESSPDLLLGQSFVMPETKKVEQIEISLESYTFGVLYSTGEQQPPVDFGRLPVNFEWELFEAVNLYPTDEPIAGGVVTINERNFYSLPIDLTLNAEERYWIILHPPKQTNDQYNHQYVIHTQKPTRLQQGVLRTFRDGHADWGTDQESFLFRVDDLIVVDEIKIIEDEGADFDAIVRFMQDFHPDVVTFLNEPSQLAGDVITTSPPFGVGLHQDQIRYIEEEDYFDYWEYYDSVVYIEGKDYTSYSRLGPTFASLINAPLVIGDDFRNSIDQVKGKQIICLADHIPRSVPCDALLNIEEVQKKYKTITETKKFVLTTNTDIHQVNGLGTFFSKRNSVPIRDIYYSSSLLSPIVASMQQALIVTVNPNGQVDTQWKDWLKKHYPELFRRTQVKQYERDDYFLTVMATDEIPHRAEHVESPWYMAIDGYLLKRSLDNTLYGNLDRDLSPEMAVGRIQGLTHSDDSSLIARSWFIPHDINEMRFIGRSGALYTNLAKRLAKEFEEKGYASTSFVPDGYDYTLDPNQWKGQDLIYYIDHGATHYAGINSGELPDVKNTFIINKGCNTCRGDYSDVMCNWVTRNGGVGNLGAVGWSLSHDTFPEVFIRKVTNENLPIGVAVKESYNNFDRAWTLKGDPTIQLHPKNVEARQ